MRGPWRKSLEESKASSRLGKTPNWREHLAVQPVLDTEGRGRSSRENYQQKSQNIIDNFKNGHYDRQVGCLPPDWECENCFRKTKTD